MRTARWAICCWIIAASADLSYAGPLNLVPEFPDITTTKIKITYTKASSLFKATALGGMGLDLNGGGPEYGIAGSYTLTAQIDNGGNFVNGSLVISGVLTVFGDTSTIFSGDQLLGTLTEFGYQRKGPTGAIFEFRFDVTGGYLYNSHLFPSLRGGIILSAQGSSANYFDATGFGRDFTLKSAVADTFVPTPTALPAGVALLAVAMVLGICRRNGRADMDSGSGQIQHDS